MRTSNPRNTAATTATCRGAHPYVTACPPCRQVVPRGPSGHEPTPTTPGDSKEDPEFAARYGGGGPGAR